MHGKQGVLGPLRGALAFTLTLFFDPAAAAPRCFFVWLAEIDPITLTSTRQDALLTHSCSTPSINAHTGLGWGRGAAAGAMWTTGIEIETTVVVVVLG